MVPFRSCGFEVGADVLRCYGTAVVYNLVYYAYELISGNNDDVDIRRTSEHAKLQQQYRRPARQHSQPFLSAARRWARQQMERITKELEHATGNKRDSLRQTRRIYSSFVRGDDILQDSEDEEEEHARQEAEAAAAEEDEAETAAAAAAREAEEEAARTADPDARASQIAQWIRRRWERRVKYPQSSIDGVTMFPRPPPFAAMGVPQESVADPDSSWAQINGTVARDLAVSKFETFGNVPEELQARMATVVGDVLRRVLAHPVDPSDMLNASSESVREQSRALMWFIGLPQLFLRKVTTGPARRACKKQIERRLTYWENRQYKHLIEEWQADCLRQPPPSKRTQSRTAKIEAALRLIDEGEMSRGVRFLHSIATGMGIVDLDTPGVIEQLEAKHPKRKRRVPSFPEFGVPRRGPVEVDVVRKGRKLRRRVGVGADGWRNEHIRAILQLHGDVDADATAELLNVFAGRFVGGMLPRWYYSLALIARMLALWRRPKLVTSDRCPQCAQLEWVAP